MNHLRDKFLLTLSQGYDCCIHMSEETADASKTIPLVVLWAVAGNAVMLLLVGITFIFCLGDLDSVLNSPTGQPMIQVFYNATQSVAGTSVMVAVVVIVLMSACVGQVATSSRQMWSFARDHGTHFWVCAANSR
jgi:choline transport protein